MQHRHRCWLHPNSLSVSISIHCSCTKVIHMPLLKGIYMSQYSPYMSYKAHIWAILGQRGIHHRPPADVGSHNTLSHLQISIFCSCRKVTTYASARRHPPIFEINWDTSGAYSTPADVGSWLTVSHLAAEYFSPISPPRFLIFASTLLPLLTKTMICN